MLQVAVPLLGIVVSGDTGPPWAGSASSALTVLQVNGRGEAVGLVSHSAGPFTQAVPIGRALAVAGL
ncbi:hypothetical protein ACFQNJ_18870 [Hydrogenophaga bisanensis]|uniref:Uncharacterized protein n=1 Tax=Hydrogenophaga bisanensis TaxID=439611 RepID=A0ABW2REP3_9BURK